MLEIKNVHKTFNKGTINEKKALNGVNLHLDPGDFVTIIGGNGAGKSTTLNMVAGVYPIDQGTIILDGKDISDLPEYKRAYMLGRVFQDPMMGTAAGMQIEENMAMANRRGKKRGLSWGITKKEKEMFKEKLTKIFSIAAAGIMLFSLMGCGDSSQDGKIIIRMTHTQQPESISDLTAKEFQKYVDEKEGNLYEGFK